MQDPAALRIVRREASQALEQPDLELGQRIDVRIAKFHRSLEDRRAVQQPLPAGHPAEHRDRPPVLGFDRVPAPVVARAGGQCRIEPSDAHVGLGEAHLGVVEEARQERPVPGEPGDRVEPGVAMHRPVGLQGEAQPVPAGQVDPCLGPGEGPRDRPQRIDRRRRILPPTRRRPRPQAKVGQLADRGDIPEERREARVVVDQAPIGGARRGGELRQDGRPGRQRPRRSGVVLRRRCEEDGAGHLLQVAPGDRRVGIVRGNDLALLGQLEAAIHGAWRLAEDGAVRRAAAATDGTAAPVEEGQPDATRTSRVDEGRLRPVQTPGRGQEARLLVRIRVAEHDLLAITPGRDAGPVARVVEQLPEDGPGRVERRTRLEERHEIEGRRGSAGRIVGLHRQPGERQDVGHVGGSGREADDVAVARVGPEPHLGRSDRPERGEHLTERHAGRDVCGGGSALTDRIQRRRVDRRVLADLERREMEPERPELPAQVGDLAPGDSAQTIGDQCVLDLDQFCVEVMR